MTPFKRLTASVLIFSFLTALLLVPERQATASAPAQAADETDDVYGLQFRLSEGGSRSEPVAAARVVSATELSQSETESIVRRLPPMTVDPSSVKEFALRENSLPPPRTGNTVDTPFPAAATADVAPITTGPLEVVRYSPSGDVAIAPELSITFSQPMVQLTSQDQAATNVPVKLSPQPTGKWRWLGTKTLIFEAQERLPMATTYVVTVPAGTRAANGSTLATERSWRFTTPPLSIKSSYPTKEETRPRDALMFIEFDQRINPAAVMPAIRVTGGNRILKTRLATSEEIEQELVRDPGAKHITKAAHDRWLAIRAVDPQSGKPEFALPADSQIKVALLPGASSTEGPNRTQTSHDFSFKTYGPLKITSHGCNDEGRCNTHDSFAIEFNNSLADDFDESKIRVEPALESMEVEVYDSSISIQGMKRANTTYRVTLDKSIKDEFNQTLGRDLTFAFRVGPSERRLYGPAGDFVVMDPAAPSRCSIFSINYTRLKVQLYSVTPDDWPKWFSYRKSENSKPPVLGRLVFSRTIPIKNVPNDFVETVVDLSPALTSGHGQMILVAEPLGGIGPRDPETDPDIIRTWIQVTNIGLNAFVDRTDLVGWVTSLQDGAPLSDVDVSLLSTDISARSGPDGLARLALKSSTATGPGAILARGRDGDVAILPEEVPYSNTQASGWRKREAKDSLRWFVFDDRKMYQPGEEIHVKGWIRRIAGGKTGDTDPAPNTITRVAYVLSDSRNNQLKAGNISVNAFGGFDWSIKLPDQLNLGYTTLKLQALSTLEGTDYNHHFQVQEFRRPEFEVNTKSDSEGPFFVGASADVSVNASYFAGGGLAAAPVEWSVNASQTQFTPPNRSDYVFGKWTPWWTYSSYGTTTSQRLSGATDATGKHRLHIDFNRVNPALPSTVIATASVTDVNRQVWSSTTTLLVHPADLYVGLKPDKTVLEKDQPLRVQAIVTDLDGKLIEGREIKLVASRLRWDDDKEEWIETEPQECSIRSTEGPATCTFQPKEGGEYRVRATVRDDRERRNESELTIWVSGAKSPTDSVEEDEIQLISDRKDYKAGDVAEILVQAPFYPAEGVWTVRRSGMLKVERFRMDNSTTILRVPIEASWIPNVQVQVDLLGQVERELPDKIDHETVSLPKQPAFATGTVKLSIPPLDRRLTITATPRDKSLEPGAETSVSVEVKDAAGAPVAGGEVAVVVVDEAVLSLTNYTLNDPVAAFYPERGDEVEDVEIRSNLWAASFPSLVAASYAGGGGPAGSLKSSDGFFSTKLIAGIIAPPPPEHLSLGKSDAASAELIRIRQDFNALAVFAPSVTTDTNGRAEVKLKLPDNLTRYRVMAVAVAGGKQFGSGESLITARMPLMVRPSAPRFLNFGDAFEFPVVVQNQTDASMSVDVTLRASNVRLPGQQTSSALSGRRVTVPANDRVEVRIPVTTATAGTARFQVAAVSGRWSDATEVALPVWTPATTESFATYGEIDQGAISQPVKAPAEVFKEFGGLEIEASSTQLQQLTDAFLYLQNYPYECSEQLASRILSIAALRDVLQAFKSEGLPSQPEIEASVVRDLKRLEGIQNEDGGFAFWKRGEKSWPFLSLHVAHALVRARQKGFTVEPRMYDRAIAHARNIESHIPSDYGVDAKRALTAYALYVRALAGNRDYSKARKLMSIPRLDDLSLETIGWLLFVLSGDAASPSQVAKLRLNLQNRVAETAGTAHFVSSYRDADHLLLNSDRRADAVVLEALIVDQPANDLIPKIVRGLLSHRTKGRWSNTQDNVFVLLALDRYFKTYEKVTPDFVARVWLGNAYAGEQTFKGRSVDRQRVNVPMQYLANKVAAQNLVISKGGEGRLYYRLALSYAPSNSNIVAGDYGFAVDRKYEAIDDPGDVRRDADGLWRVRAGVRVRVRVTMAALARRYHVALVDYLPAGFESLNPELAITGPIPEDKKEQGSNWWLWRRVWFDHQNLRDERAEAFAALLWGGVYNYTYVTRATTPGLFVVPPAKAEEMYHPETFGRSTSARVRIE